MSTRKSTLAGKLRCLQSLLQQLGANVACEAVSEAIEQLADANLAQPAQSVDAMVLVPAEPTQAMLEAMAESYWGETWNAPGMGDDRLIDARNMYDEALTAALQEKGNG